MFLVAYPQTKNQSDNEDVFAFYLRNPLSISLFPAIRPKAKYIFYQVPLTHSS
jgi:hypothetical protein